MSEGQPYTFEPIGYLKSCFETRNGTPRQAGLAPAAPATLKLTSTQLNNPAFSLEGLCAFSHVWLVFVFHLDRHAQSSLGDAPASGTVKSKIAPPRLNGAKLGLFATRSPHRPVPIGLSLVKLVGVQEDTLTFEGVDLVNGTPVLDVKPFIPTWDEPTQLGADYAAHQTPVHLPDWAQTQAIYEQGLNIRFTLRATKQLGSVFQGPRDSSALLKNSENFMKVLGQLLAAEPRSRYRRDRCSDRLYFVELDGLHVTAWFDEEDGQDVAEVLRISTRGPQG
jgi:tRNA-Thr(GGU) m(6)t(6)A37 methyltransferase TsaA